MWVVEGGGVEGGVPGSQHMRHFCVMGWNEVPLNSSVASVILIPYHARRGNAEALAHITSCYQQHRFTLDYISVPVFV
jgi:hypothetical protein